MLKMETQTDFMRVETLLGLRKKNMMYENREYQRGKVWSKTQQKMLIDSVLRGYSIPSFHLHFIEDREGDIVAQRFEVIDGQQRLRALSAFREGSFKLLDPKASDLPTGVLFTHEAKEEPCAWAGRTFQDLDTVDCKRFLNTEMIVVKVTNASEEAVRDLFIRQQGGTPLSPQEIRDAWPGGMTDIILQIGGKQGLDRCPGHDLFRELLRNPGRPAGRQVAAQMFSLLVGRRERGEYRSIARKRIDQFYYDHLSITDDDPHVRRFRKILGKLDTYLSPSLTFRLVGHEAIALMLLVDDLLDDHVPGWERKLASAFLEFRTSLTTARRKKKEGDSNDPYWLHYGIHTQTASDQGETIQERYAFFRERMTESIGPKPKDSRRTADGATRDAIFQRQDGRCPVCCERLDPRQFEVHHIEPHAHGGETKPENLAAVHSTCHPKTDEAVQNFRKKLAEFPC
ncbi:HNH endonuclease family protein [Candidatus Palauibacter sp.]|uniref:HNH endonuclease family protein n=1 Tax=Candidatus Palauibacter sp. TaxID=3101350 RepID=UPI003C6F8E7E